MDIWDKEKRSEVMALVRGKNTKPEVIVRKYLFSQGLRYRVNVKNLPGKPDIVLPKYNAVIFVHGCFWHGHQIGGSYHRRFPVSNAEFWREKIEKNANRDIQNQERLRKIGWRIFVIWECELSSKEKRERTFNNLVEALMDITVLLKDILKDKSYPEGGYDLFCQAEKVIESGGRLNLDMEGFESVPTTFMNTSFGDLIAKYGIEKTKKLFVFSNITKSQIGRIRKYFDDYQLLLNQND